MGALIANEACPGATPRGNGTLTSSTTSAHLPIQQSLMPHCATMLPNPASKSSCNAENDRHSFSRAALSRPSLPIQTGTISCSVGNALTAATLPSSIGVVHVSNAARAIPCRNFTLVIPTCRDCREQSRGPRRPSHHGSNRSLSLCLKAAIQWLQQKLQAQGQLLRLPCVCTKAKDKHNTKT